jgi:hypothetical protein
MGGRRFASVTPAGSQDLQTGTSGRPSTLAALRCKALRVGKSRWLSITRLRPITFRARLTVWIREADQGYKHSVHEPRRAGEHVRLGPLIVSETESTYDGKHEDVRDEQQPQPEQSFNRAVSHVLKSCA